MNKTKRILWLVYILITILSVVLEITSAAMGKSNLGISDWVNLLVSIWYSLGVIGYITNQPFMNRKLWVFAFFINLIGISLGVLSGITLYALGEGTSALINYVGIAIWVMPAIYALYKYSRIENTIWSVPVGCAENEK